jgi:transcriptional regulator with XRE-family HTH domain
MGYHYGLTIREGRIAKCWTLAKLASEWPSKEGGVTVRYIQDIESGIKKIADVETLRKLASLLDIPLWKLGLSEYNPFDEKDITTQPFIDMNTLHEIIEDIWYIRLNMPIEIVEKKITSLASTFANLINNNTRLLENKDFLVLYAQIKRLQEIIYTERHNYKMSLKCSYDMLELAKKSGDVKTECIAMVRIGVELLRDENKDAIECLEKARDLSFVTLSKEIGAYCYSFLARGYATFGEEKRFTQAINTAITLADNMKGFPVVTKDYVFHAYSAVLEEKSNGLITLGKGKEAFEGLQEIDNHIAQENNTYLKMWIPLDYAQSFMLMREIETSIKWLETFYASIKNYKSARIHSRINRHLNQLDGLGYADLPEVKDFKSRYDVTNNHTATE